MSMKRKTETHIIKTHCDEKKKKKKKATGSISDLKSANKKTTHSTKIGSTTDIASRAHTVPRLARPQTLLVGHQPYDRIEDRGVL